MKTKESYYQKEPTRTNIIFSEEDEYLDNMISSDMSRIWQEVGGQDGMYNNFPISRIYRDGDFTRCYALDECGGIAIISSNLRNDTFNMITLGEDDGYHFLHSRDTYCSYYGNKMSFMELTCLALSMFNNNVKREI